MRQSEIAETNEQANEVVKPMSDYVSGAAEALKAIQTDKRALWFVGLRPLYIVLFVTAVAVFAAGAYTGWEKTFVFFFIPVVAMLVAVGALAVTYVSGQNSIKKRIVQFSQCVSMAKLSFIASGKVIDEQRREHEKASQQTATVKLIKLKKNTYPSWKKSSDYTRKIWVKKKAVSKMWRQNFLEILKGTQRKLSKHTKLPCNL